VRERGLVIFITVSVIFLFAFGTINILGHNELLGIFELLTGILGTFLFIYYEKTKDYEKASNLFLLLLLVLYSVLLITGGMEKTGIYWIFVFPTISPLLKEPKEAVIWNLVYLLVLLIVLLLHVLGKIPLPYSIVEIRQALMAYGMMITFLLFYSYVVFNYIKEIEMHTVIDPLTELYNRRFVYMFLEKELENLKRGNLEKLCVVYIDLDGFKQVNDKFGHITGDEVLKEVARLIKENFRKSDVVARIGGDEFLVIAVNCDEGAILEKLSSLRKLLERKFENYGISMSFGLATAPDDSTDIAELIKIADKRMYNCKKRKKEGVYPHMSPRSSAVDA